MLIEDKKNTLLKKFIGDSSFVIVGNSGSIKSHKGGSEIDKYDLVFRFNNFETEGFEDYTGTKTSSWVTSFYLNITIDDNVPSFIFMPFPYGSKKYKYKYNDLLIKSISESHDVIFMSEAVRNEISKISLNPSTGALFLYWLYSQLGEVKYEQLRGINCFSENHELHYFANGDVSEKKSANVHRIHDERIFQKIFK